MDTMLAEHSGIEKDPHHVLEQPRRATGHAHASVDQARGGAALTFAEQGAHDLGRLGRAHRAELEQLVTRVADLAPAFVARQELGPRQAHDHDRALQILDQVTE